jgi:zinc transporter
VPGKPLQCGAIAMTETLAAGLICAYGFGSNGNVRELSLPVLGDLMRTPDGFLWAHLNISVWPMRNWIGDRSELPEIVREVLVASDDIRPRFERCGDGLVGTLSDVQHDFSGQSGDIGTLHVWFTRTMLITTRSHPLTAVDKLRLDIRDGFHPATTGELIGALIDHLAASFHKVIEEMVERLDEIEDAILVGISNDLRSQLGDLRRQIVSLRRQLLPQRRALSRLLSQPPSWWSADDLHDLREAGERFSSVAEDLGAAEDRAKVLQDEFSAKLAEEANRNLFRLSIVTLIFLPMTLVTGIFGMNVAGLPGTHDALSFWWVMVLMVASAGATLLLLKVKHWF